MPQALRRTYASLSLDIPQPSPVPPSVLSPALTRKALQPIMKHPATTSSRRRFYRHSSLLGPRPRHSLHPDRPDHQIVPPFKPGRKLYRKVLKQEFLRATKKVTMEALTTTNDSDLTTTDDIDDKWTVAI